MQRKLTTLLATLILAWLGEATKAQAGLLLVASYDASVTAPQEAMIQQALNFYNTSFANNATIRIEFITGGSGGNSLANPISAGYGTVKQALTNVAAFYNDPVLSNAMTFWPVGNVANNIELTSADCRIMGLGCAANVSGTGSFVGSTFDGVVTVDATLYTSTSVIDHEINEVLGVGGWGTILTNTTTGGTTQEGILDPYRFSAPNTPSFTNSTSAAAYFSLNGGATNIANFNQSGNGDYGDLTTSPCYVQSWSTCSNPAAMSLTSPEGYMLQGAGYAAVSSGSATPEPATWSMIGFSLVGLGVMARRRGRAVI